jgi:hypothetical protein
VTNRPGANFPERRGDQESSGKMALPHSRPTPEGKEQGRPSEEDRPPGVQPTDGRSGRTSAEPYPPDGDKRDTKKGPQRPAADHPWRRGFKRK